MKSTRHTDALYKGDLPKEYRPSEASLKIGRIAESAALHRLSGVETNVKRSSFSRAVDSLLAAMRRYVPPIHRIGSVIGAVGFYVYAQLVARTMRLATLGSPCWPEFQTPCVLAVWHGNAPSLLVAITKRKPPIPLAIMISGDPRGDCLALLCRFLGVEVVRGGGDEGGWEALIQLSSRIDSGKAVLITADGSGPARVAKVDR
jgi:hypothetical protein